MILFDTDILINHQRGKKEYSALLDKYKDKAISIITYMEFLQKPPNKKVLKDCKDLIADWEFEIIHVDENIGHRASIYIEEFSLSHNLGIMDAIIAATATERNLRLLTANRKHYKMIRNIQLVKAA